MKARVKYINYITEGVVQLIFVKKRKGRFTHQAYTALGEVAAKIAKLKVQAGDIIDLTSFYTSRKHNERWYSTMTIEDIIIVEKKNTPPTLFEEGSWVNEVTGEVVTVSPTSI